VNLFSYSSSSIYEALGYKEIWYRGIKSLLKFEDKDKQFSYIIYLIIIVYRSEKSTMKRGSEMGNYIFLVGLLWSNKLLN
jgi:hypothetical protein